MGLHLLNNLGQQLTHRTILGMDNQAVIKALKNQKSHAGQYILDTIHDLAEKLSIKQDQLISCVEMLQVTEARGKWSGRKCGIIDLQVHWVPGHCGFKPNEKADEEAKKAAEGNSSNAKLLPPLLCKYLPLSSSAFHQENMTKLAK
jgi:ribonuclease HI